MMKQTYIFLLFFILLFTTSPTSTHAQTCDRANLTLNNMTNLGNNQYQFDLTFCTRGGYDPNEPFGAVQNTWRFAFFVRGGATIIGYPASLTSPATNTVYTAYYFSQHEAVLYLHPSEWWSCTDANCGPVQSVCQTITLTTNGLPTQIEVQGLEGAGNPAAGCLGPDVTVDIPCTGNQIDPNLNTNRTTTYLGYPAEECATISVGYNGPGNFTYTWSTGDYGTSITVCPQATCDYIVTAKDQNGCTSKDTITITVEDVRCGRNNDKVQLCFGNRNRCVSQSRAATLISRGATFGNCSANSIAPSTELMATRLATDTEFTVFPNPSDQATTLTYTAKTDDHIQIQLFDLTGKMIKTVFSGTVLNGNTHQFLLPTEELEHGIYFIRLNSTTNGQSKTLRLIVR
jgi:hypothetical protein